MYSNIDGLIHGKEGLNVIYSNTDGLIHRKLELQDYLKEKSLKMYLMEVKLKKESQQAINNNYSMVYGGKIGLVKEVEVL